MEKKDSLSDRKRNKSKQKLTPGLLILVLVSFIVMAIFGAELWTLLVLVLAYIRWKVNKEQQEKEEDIPETKECELCGIRTENLISVRLPKEDRDTLVCEECYRANGFRRAADPGEPVQEEAVEAEPARETERLISETDAEREARLAGLAEKKKSGAPLREDLFLEDIEEEKSIRVIYDIWESYGFGSDYPGIETSLVRLKQTGVSSAKAGRLKEELWAMLHGEDD